MKQNVPRTRTTSRRPAAKSKMPRISARQEWTLLVIFMLSFGLSLTLELYVFGFPDGFFGRWFSAFMVFFLFFTITALGIIPLINYVSRRWLQFLR